MDDPSLIGVHGLQSTGTSGTDRVVGQLLCQLLQGLFPFLPVVAAVQGDAEVVPFQLVGHQAGKILERVQRLSPAAYHDAQSVPAQGQQRALLLFLDINLHIWKAHRSQNLPEIFRRPCGFAVFLVHPYLCHGCSEAQKSLLRHFQYLILDLIRAQAQFLTSRFNRLFHSFSCFDLFLHQGKHLHFDLFKAPFCHFALLRESSQVVVRDLHVFLPIFFRIPLASRR